MQELTCRPWIQDKVFVHQEVMHHNRWNYTEQYRSDWPREHSAHRSLKEDRSMAIEIRQPNLFELEAYETRITYSVSSIAGVPQLSYQDPNLSRNFSGEDIRQLET